MAQEYESSETADAAYLQWAGLSDGDGGGGTTQTASTWSGSLSMPSEIPNGGGFEAEATVRNNGETRTPSIHLAVVDPSTGDLGALDTERERIEAGGSTRVSFAVERGQWSLDPGDYRFHLYVYHDTDEGSVDTETVTVTGADGEGDDGMDGWSDPVHVRELPYGWHLYRQEKGDKSRWIVAGKTESGELVYLNKRGQVQQELTESAYFYSLDEVAAALQAFAQRLENGGVPRGQRPTGQRPQPEEVKRAVAAQGRRAARRKKMLLYLAGALVLAGGYVYYKRGADFPDDIPLVGGTLGEVM